MAPAVLTCIPGTIPVHVPIPMPIKHAKTKSNISLHHIYFAYLSSFNTILNLYELIFKLSS